MCACMSARVGRCSVVYIWISTSIQSRRPVFMHVFICKYAGIAFASVRRPTHARKCVFRSVHARASVQRGCTRTHYAVNVFVRECPVYIFIYDSQGHVCTHKNLLGNSCFLRIEQFAAKCLLFRLGRRLRWLEPLHVHSPASVVHQARASLAARACVSARRSCAHTEAREVPAARCIFQPESFIFTDDTEGRWLILLKGIS